MSGSSSETVKAVDTQAGATAKIPDLGQFLNEEMTIVGKPTD